MRCVPSSPSASQHALQNLSKDQQTTDLHIMTRQSADVEWKPVKNSRRSSFSYKVHDGKLIRRSNDMMEGSKISSQKDAIGKLVKHLRRLNIERNTSVMSEYKMGLLSYLYSLMRATWKLVKARNWTRLKDTLHDYLSREALGCRHDIDGREYWKAKLMTGEWATEPLLPQ